MPDTLSDIIAKLGDCPAFAEYNELRSGCSGDLEDLADAALRELANRLEASEKRADRLFQDRYDLLTVDSTDGLLSSVWVMRTATAERRAREAEAEVERLRLDLQRSMWVIGHSSLTATERERLHREYESTREEAGDERS